MAKKIAIIQARMSSTRLPGKVLKKINEKPMLDYVIKQTLASKHIDEVIIATTKEEIDIPIIEYCKKNKLKFFRGSKNDLLDRYYKCAKKFRCNPIIRITSDCPLIDPKVIDKIFEKFQNNLYDYVSNNIEKINKKWDNSMCNYPQGMTVEISSFKALEKAWKEAKKPSEREHVFPYIQFNNFKISRVKNKTDFSYIRCTVDRKEDLKFIKELLKILPKNKKFFQIKDIVKAIEKHPEITKINQNISFLEGWKKSIKEDKLKGFI